MYVKRYIKNKLHPLVWERLGQAKQEYFWTKQNWHCEKNLEPIFKKYFSKHGGYYVDIGANDGRSFSNTYHLEFDQKWTGILVEPIMHVSFRSRQLRNPDSNKFFNAACVGTDYEGENVELIYSGLMSISKTEDQKYDPDAWAKEGSQFLSRGEVAQRTWSQARTVDSILAEAEAPAVIELLSIDVEGAEYDVLKGIDFETRLIEYVLVETEVDSKAYRLLRDAGFNHIETVSQNLLFRHRSKD